jgi:tRNA (guanine-N7-)-methyltransferase
MIKEFVYILVPLQSHPKFSFINFAIEFKNRFRYSKKSSIYTTLLASMKPKDLKPPFNWETRQPTFYRDVLFVPTFYQEHHTWSSPEWDGHFIFSGIPLHIEYCSGNGDWIAAKAKANPAVNWVAVEKCFDRVRKIWSKKENFNLSNLLIVCGKALDFTTYYLPDSCADAVYVNFPDPWPKKKHAKHRIIRSPFIEEMSRVVKEKGSATIVTDDLEYSEQILGEMTGEGSWNCGYPPPHFNTEYPDYGASFFGDLFKGQGKEIRYMKFMNGKP